MLKRLLISSCAAVLLVGCTTTETKPVSPTSASVPAKVTQPAAKAVKQVLKPKAAVKPKTTSVKATEPAVANSDVALGKQWASCAGQIEALSVFGNEIIQSNPTMAANSSFEKQLANFKKFPIVRDSFYAYASVAATPLIADTEMNRAYTQQYTAYKTNFNALQQSVLKGEDKQSASNRWLGQYFDQFFGFMKNLSGCESTLTQNHPRFDAGVKPSMQFNRLEDLFSPRTQQATSAKKTTKKRSRKAS